MDLITSHWVTNETYLGIVNSRDVGVSSMLELSSIGFLAEHQDALGQCHLEEHFLAGTFDMSILIGS